MKKISNADSNASTQSGEYLKRPRLNKLLQNAIDYPLIVVCAGSGYGKTRAVSSFLKGCVAQTAWLQISGRDNITTRLLESFTGMISLAWPEIGAGFKEIGFPETDEAFAKWDALRSETAVEGKHIRVFDDFHLLQNPGVLRFFEHMVNTSPPNITVILISRTMPKINLVGLIMRERVFTIEEDALRFTEKEIYEYFNQLELPVTREDIRNIHEDTQGWAFALNLIGRSLTKEGKYERHALKAMKKNIFRFIEAEINQTVSETLWRFLLRISLIDHLAAGLVNKLAKGEALIGEMELLTAYIRYDFNLDTYMIHHLFRDYLRQKQEQILTDEERRETYQAAGAWCEANGYHMDALSYYEKAGNYDAVTRKIASLNLQMPQDMARYALDILELMPYEARALNQIFPAMFLKLKISLGHFEEASAFAERAARDYLERSESPERNRALTAIFFFWGLLRMKMCTYIDVYDFDAYFKKMAEYFNKNPFEVIGSYKAITLGAWASNVGTSRPGAMEEYIAAVSRMATYFPSRLIGFYDGLEDLLRGELCFYQRKFSEAEQYLKQSIAKSGLNDQYATQNRSLVYLMHVYFSRGDFILATRSLKETEYLLSEKDYGIRSTIYDIASGFYQLALNQPEHISEWLKGDFSPFSHPSFLENYANRIRTRYHYQTWRHSALLAFIENVIGQTTILFDKIELRVLQALSLYRLKRRSEAIAAFTEAYYLAESNKIIAAFTEHAKDMRTLSYAALRDAACPIPRKWLEDINSISSTYAKRKTKMMSQYRQANNLKAELELTSRERAVLKDMSDGLSRNETAASQNISVNTVKMVTDAIYNKLGANSLAEAVRMAVGYNII